MSTSRAKSEISALSWQAALLISMLFTFGPHHSFASDHADPVDLLNVRRLEGGITDLFVFPVLADDSPAFPFMRKANLPLHDTLADIVREPLTPDEHEQVDALVFILCVRRQLTDSSTLQLEPYTYSIHIDVDSQVDFPTTADLEAERKIRPAPSTGATSSGYGGHIGGTHQTRPTIVEAFARYGGRIRNPESIYQDITMEFRLTNSAQLQPGYPKFRGSSAAGWSNSDQIKVTVGVFEDPFIFPSFFGTNVVGIAVRVPISLMPADRTNFLIWGASHKGKRQVDHVGRSLRTQNPRFEMLNTLHPQKHVAALIEEHEHPSLMRDLFLRFNFASLFAFRAWDFVPDVMCYSTLYPVGFPNGRLLTDDVAAILAQHGDTLLYELSYQDNNGRWPRQMTNDRTDGSYRDESYRDGSFNANFPYLLPPFDDRPQPPPRRLTTASILKLIGIGLLLIIFWILQNLAFARWYYRRKRSRQYL